MGLGRLLPVRAESGPPPQMRSTRYAVTDTVSGGSAIYTVNDGLAPNWASSSYFRGAMTIPAGWRGSLMLANLIGEMPWRAYRTMGDAPEELIEPNPPLLEQPAPPDTRMTTFVSFALDYIWNGNAVGLWAARNAYGWPTAVVPVPAQFVAVRRVTPFVDSPLPVGALEYKIGNMTLGSADVLHIKGPCQPGAVRGMGVLENHFDTINLSRDQMRQAQSVSQHGVPSGLITTDDPEMDEVRLALLKEQWLANQNSRTVQALSAAVKFQPLSWNPEESQMVEARKFTLTDWENIFGLPNGWLGGSTPSKSYSNVEQDAINVIKFSLQDKITQFEQTFSLAFPRGTVARANLDAMLRTDTLTRYTAHKIARDGGWLTVDEIRELEHRKPLPKQPVVAEPGDVKETIKADAGAPGQPPQSPVQAQATVGKPAANGAGKPVAIGAGKP
jgi:HK97 family phage portal protein